MDAADVDIRPLEPAARVEVELVARRMADTLDEVLGANRDSERYGHDWLVNRVLQHLDPSQIDGQVLVAAKSGVVVGHTIVRIDADEAGNAIGLFSTIYVAPAHRRSGIATALIKRGEAFFHDRAMRTVTYTDRGNQKLQELFLRHGYSMTPMPRNFVALSRQL